VASLSPTPLYLDSARPIPDRIRDLLSRMTVEEKISQLTAYWFHDLRNGQMLSADRMQMLLGTGIGQIARIGGTSTLAPVEVARAGNTIQRFLKEHTRLGIPALLHEECCAGYMGLGGTIFPQMIGLASTWNPELVERITTEIRRQMLAVGARQGLAPVLDVAYDPRWGRTEELFGEDPLLVARIGAAYIRGLQGGEPRRGVLATAKHFIGHSRSAGGLNCAPVDLGPRALRETYLLPFQAAVQESGVRTVMNAYHELDGEVVAASRRILTDLLRGEVGFTGLVVADYSAIAMIHTYHHAAADSRGAAARAMRAGIDVELPARDCYGEPLRAALEAGEVAPERIDAAVERILAAKFDLGLFEQPYADEAAVAESFETPAQRELAREAAGQTLVLLKNDGMLPLKNPPTIAVIGPNADAPRHLLGDYSYVASVELIQHPPAAVVGLPILGDLDWEYLARQGVKTVSILDAIRARAPKQTRILHAAGCSVSGPERAGFAEALAAAAQADVVILVVGDKSGFTLDCTSGETRDRAELGLPGAQQALAEALAETGKPIVTVLVNGRPLATPWLHEHSRAVLEAWLPGEEGAAAVAGALFGDINPGGKLPVTVPRSVGQVPITYNPKPSGSRSNWYGQYQDESVLPLYPFGHGLSYTTFAYSGLNISPAEANAGETVAVSLSVANTGKQPGEEVVQLYICDPVASLPRPVRELKGFVRIRIDPGRSRKVTFNLPVDLLAFYDESLDLVTEPGQIQVRVGSSSADIRLQGIFTITGSGKKKINRRVTACPVSVD
jgi:beta-glucosidase